MYEIKVTGMTCGGCVKSITNALKAFDSKADVDVDLGVPRLDVNDVRAIADFIEARFLAR